MITNEEVLVNGEIETAKRKKIRIGDRVEAQGTTITVVA
jgi:ribosome-associated protein YbcJ (S4-like RNA binding protein)